MPQDPVPTRSKGEIGVIPTDTMYGIVGSALDKVAVERIYRVRKRTPSKPLIILIDSTNRLKDFAINPFPLLNKIWPDKITVILPCPGVKYKYLHRGTDKLAFRVPKDVKLRRLLKRTGPLVAPSANPEGEAPARTIKEAREYFGTNVDYYIDGGRMSDLPSTIIEISGEGKATLVREGAVKVSSGKLKALLQ